MASNDNIEDKIREAARLGKIEFASTESIEDYEEIAIEFFDKVYAMNYDDCFISDQSNLNHITMPFIEGADFMTMAELNAASRKLLVERVEQVYGITVDPYDLFINVFEQIRVSRLQPKS